jgi:hypothetical protein
VLAAWFSTVAKPALGSQSRIVIPSGAGRSSIAGAITSVDGGTLASTPRSLVSAALALPSAAQKTTAAGVPGVDSDEGGVAEFGTVKATVP